MKHFGNKNEENLLRLARMEIVPPTPKPVGLENKLSEVLGYLKGTEYAAIGIVGPAGIGKTTLLEAMKRSLRDDNHFTQVIFVQLTKTVKIVEIQQKIADQLMVVPAYLDESNNEQLTLRAVNLQSALLREDFLILLDDVWELPDLREIGIPRLRGRCKIVFATRLKRKAESEFSKKVKKTGRSLSSCKVVEMEYLNTENSLKLFNRARCYKGLEDEEIARKIVGKCGGLPLALVNVGKAAANRSNLETIDEALTNSPAKIDGMEENLFHALQSSLDYIRSEMVRAAAPSPMVEATTLTMNSLSYSPYYKNPLGAPSYYKNSIGGSLQELLAPSLDRQQEWHETEMMIAMLIYERIISCFIFCASLRDLKDNNSRQLLDYRAGEELMSYLLDYRAGEELMSYLLDYRAGMSSDLREDYSYHNRQKTQEYNSVIIRQLQDIYLLEKGRDEDHIRMHYMVHAMARWLATGGGGDIYHGIKIPRAHFDGADISVDKMNGIEMASFIDVDIEKLSSLRLTCPHLQTLWMGVYDSRAEAQSRSLCHYQLIESEEKKYLNIKGYNIPNDFFKKMPALHVLDITGRPILHLPYSLSCLKLLRYLNLSWTFVEKIPLGFVGLESLEYLDLNHTPFLSSIPKETIAGLRRLRSFKLYNSFYSRVDEDGQLSLRDLNSKPSLQELQLTIQEWQVCVDLLRSENLADRTTSLQLAFVDGVELGSKVWRYRLDRKLETLSIKSCQLEVEEANFEYISHYLKALILQDITEVTKLRISSLRMVRKLKISQCNELEDLACLCQLGDLQIFEMEQCEGMTELVKQPHQSSGPHKDHTKCFLNLKSLRLDYLPKLASICHCSLLFSSLEAVLIDECWNLKKLPIASPQDSKRKIRISCEKDWWEQLEWEDDKVKRIFSPTTFFSDNDRRDEDLLRSEIGKLEAIMGKLEEDRQHQARMMEMRKEIEHINGLLECSKINEPKLPEDEVEKHRARVEASIHTARELLSEVTARNGEASCRNESKHGEEINEGGGEERVRSLGVGEDTLDRNPYERSVHAEKLSEVIKYLREDKYGLIVIAGPPWIGKTTLLVEVMNAEIQAGYFGNVIFVDMSRLNYPGSDVDDVSDYYDSEYHEELDTQITRQWVRVGEGVQTPDLLLLDDVADKRGLSRVVKFMDKINTNFRLVITTHHRQVITWRWPKSIGKAEPLKWSQGLFREEVKQISKTEQVVLMKCLDRNSSQQLFLEAAGANKAIVEDKGIWQVACEMIDRCGGLPLALSAAGRAARHWKSCADSESAKEVMRNSPTEIPGAHDGVSDVIRSTINEWSRSGKECSLYFALLRNHRNLNTDLLIRYWYGADVVDDHEQGQRIIARLTGTFLIEDGVGEGILSMHPIIHSTICQLAGRQWNYIASHDGLEGDARSLANRMATANKASIKVEPLMELDSPKCQRLDTLFIESPSWCLDPRFQFSSDRTLMHYAMQEPRKTLRDSLKLHRQPDVIRDNFFSRMPCLAVLDMTYLPIRRLPKSVCGLKQLRHLNLSWTFIEELPGDFAQLSGLRTLDLSFTEFLTSIPREAMQGLTKMKTLKLYRSGYTRFDDDGQISGRDIRGFPKLRSLGLPLISREHLYGATRQDLLTHLFWDKDLRDSLTHLSLDDDAWVDRTALSSLLSYFPNIRVLAIKSCQGLGHGALITAFNQADTLVLWDLPTSTITVPTSLYEPGCIGIRELHIYRCSELVHLDCLCRLQHLRLFGMYECPAITTLAAKAWTEMGGHDDHNKCLPWLKYMTLDRLPLLECIFPGCDLSLDSLIHLRVMGCPKLKRIPILGGTKRKDVTVHCTSEWWGGLEWDSDETKSSFTPEFEVGTGNTTNPWEFLKVPPPWKHMAWTELETESTLTSKSSSLTRSGQSMTYSTSFQPKSEI